MTTAGVAERRSRSNSWARALAVAPAWAWVVALFAVSAGIRFFLATKYKGPWIFQDEIAYADLARSLGRTGHLAIRDFPGRNGFGPLYPVLISPAYAIFKNSATAYEAAKAINAVVMSLVVVPTYLIARRLVTQWAAIVAAALAVAIPAMVYSAAIMTEVAFYPAVIFSAWAIFAALERPTVVRQLLLFVPIAAAVLARPQAVVFGPIVVTTIVLVALTDAFAAAEGGVARTLYLRLRAFWVTWLVLALIVAGLLVNQLARGRTLTEMLGAYGGVTAFDYSLGPIARWFFFHLGALDVTTGVLPLAALIALALTILRPRAADRGVRIFTVLALATVFWFTAVAATYAANPVGDRIEERYLFHVVPLLFIALVVWLERRGPGWGPAAGIGAAAAAALPGVVPWPALLSPLVGSSAPGLVLLLKFQSKYASQQTIGEVVVLAAIAGAVLFLLLPRRWLLLGPAVVLCYLAVAMWPVHNLTRSGSLNARAASIGGPTNWIDRAVGADADVAILYYAVDALPYWENEFFNASVRRSYSIPGAYGGLPDHQVVIAPSGAVTTDGKPVRPPYVLTNQAIVPRGTPVANDRRIGLTVYRVDAPLRLEAKVDGVYPDRWSGPTAAYTRYGCAPRGRLTVSLLGDPTLEPKGVTVTATAGGKELGQAKLPPALHPRSFTVPVTAPRQGPCVVTFAVSPTVVPAQLAPTADQRELGVRFLSFRYEPRSS
jgi:Dolichyl-phosphate-mannose-protein mannosyltransferase